MLSGHIYSGFTIHHSDLDLRSALFLDDSASRSNWIGTSSRPESIVVVFTHCDNSCVIGGREDSVALPDQKEPASSDDRFESWGRGDGAVALSEQGLVLL